MNLLLDTGKVNVDSKDSNSRTPLSRGAVNGHDSVVKLLLDTRKVYVDSKDSQNNANPLTRATVIGHDAVVELLLGTENVDVDVQRDFNSRKPLLAAGNGYDSVMKLFLDTGKVDVESKDSNGCTPLPWAALYGRKAIVDFWGRLGPKKADIVSDDCDSCQTLLSLWMSTILP